MTMDNTKANKAAMNMLLQDFPSMIQLGCQAHGLSLFIKDIANKKKTKWASSVMEDCLMLVNVINDNEAIKAKMQQEQRDLYGKVTS